MVVLAAGPRAIAASGLTVAAASSLTDALQASERLYDRARRSPSVTFAFGASNQLERQIEAGAPVDVFASASDTEMDRLEHLGRLSPGTRRPLARNTLVLVVPAASKVTWRAWTDLKRPDPIRRVALGAPGVPAGDYARQTLRHLGVRLGDREVPGENVRQVLAYVARGEVDAGFVFRTDAQSPAAHGVRVLAVVPDSWHAPIRYPIAVLRGPHEAAAKDYVAFLTGRKGQAILRRYGFQTAR
jgi:molybdate transport system substrate-binding protein